MRASGCAPWVFLAVFALRAAAQDQVPNGDFQSPELLFRKAYKAEFPDDPGKVDLRRAIDYYGRALRRAERWEQNEMELDPEDRSQVRLKYCVEWAVRSLISRARCYEKLDPPDEAGALQDYERVVTDFGGRAPEKVKPLVDFAGVKRKKNGVDIWLNDFAEKVEKWRRGEIQTRTLKQEQELVWGNIEGKGTEGVWGLIETLNHPEKQVRNLIAEKLQYVCHEDGIVWLIQKLAHKDYRAGAAASLRIIMERYAMVRAIEEDANRLEAQNDLLPVTPGSSKWIEERKARIQKMRDLARRERYQLPEDIETPRVYRALKGVMLDESLPPTARTEAIKILASFRRLETEAVTDLITLLDDRNPRVREAAVIAAGKVDTRKSLDKHRIADKLIELVQMEPAGDLKLEKERMSVEHETHPELRDALLGLTEAQRRGDRDAVEAARKALEDKKAELVGEIERRMANTALVRQQAALSLGKIGVVKAIPALIEALDDNELQVRRAAIEALRRLCEPLRRVSDPTRTPPLSIPYKPEAPRSEEAKRQELAKIQEEMDRLQNPEHRTALEERRQFLQNSIPFTEAQKQWRDWWARSRGVEILITRFDTFVREWPIWKPEEIYDRRGFLLQIEAQARFSQDPGKILRRAKKIADEFHEEVELHLTDLVDLVRRARNPATLEYDPKVARDVLGMLFDRLDGKVKGQPDVREATQMFVGNALARVIVLFARKPTDPDKPGWEQSAEAAARARERLRGILKRLEQVDAPVKVGAAYAVAYYPFDLPEIELDQAAAEAALTDEDVRVRIAAAYAAGRIGNYRTAKELVGSLRKPEPRGRLAAARAIGRIAERAAKQLGQDKNFMRLVGERIWAETDDPNRQHKDFEPEAEVREAICFAFGQIQHPNAFPYLLRARRDIDDRVRYAASLACGRIGAQEPQSANMLWRLYAPEGKTPKFSDRQGAILCLGDVNAKDKIPALIEKLIGSGPEPWTKWEPHQTVRAAVATALGNLGYRSPNVRDALLKALQDPAEEVRGAAYNALNHLLGGSLENVQIQYAVRNEQGQEEMVRSAFNPKLSKEDLARFASEIRNWIEINAPDKFSDPNQ